MEYFGNSWSNGLKRTSGLMYSDVGSNTSCTQTLGGEYGALDGRKNNKYNKDNQPNRPCQKKHLIILWNNRLNIQQHSCVWCYSNNTQLFSDRF